MEDTHPKLPVALILSYKRSTQANEKREPSTKEKNRKETTRKQNSRERLKVVIEEKSQRSIRKLAILFIFLFSISVWECI